MGPIVSVEFRILGPLGVLVDGREIALGGARQRAVLAILLIHRGGAVSVDRIIDELWGDDPPETATKTVQVYVSRLRKLLGADVLVTNGGGYALASGAAEVDADEFERLLTGGREALDAGDAAAASKRLEDAVGLWRGPPLADFAYDSFAQNEIARLEELRLVALENRIEADLARGRHAALVPELEALVAEHPTLERFRAQLMLALYRSGRQADALAAYKDGRRTLSTELGLEPSQELQRLEQAILNQDPAIAAPRRERPFAAARQRRGGALLAFGGGLLLAAVVAAILASGEESQGAAPPNSAAVIDPETNELVATVPTGVQPANVAAAEDSIWVANRGDDSVTQVDPKTRAVLRTVPAGTTVGGMAAGAGAVWIGGSRGWKLVRLDPTFHSRSTIPLAPGPNDFSVSAVNPVAVGGGAVWVGQSAGGVAEVDPTSNRIVTKFPVGNSPSSIATGSGSVWIADDVDNTVTRIDPRTAAAVTATTPVGQGPAAIDVGAGAVWVANTEDDTVSRLDPTTTAVTETIPVGARPTGVAASDEAVWIANSLGGSVSRINPETNEVEATIDVGQAPQGVAVADGLVWVTVQASPVSPEPSSTASPDDTMRVAVADDPGSTDPAFTQIDHQLAGATCALLYNYPDRPFPAGARLQPEVATGPPSVSADGRKYTFTLRDDFRFSPPSNEPVTAAAFERAIERVLDPVMGSYGGVLAKDIVGAKDYAAGRTRHVAGVTARGGILVIELTKPVPTLIERLATPWFCPVPPSTPVREEGVDAVPSAGPYYVASHVPDRSLVLRRNPNYAGDRPHELEEIRYEVGVPPERGAEQVEDGEYDYVDLNPLNERVEPAPPEVFRRLSSRYGPRSEAARAGHQQLFTQPTLTLYYFLFNTRRGPFADSRLRRAASFAMDRRALTAYTGLGQYGRPTDQFIPYGMPGFADVTVYPLSGPDVTRARRLAGGERHRAVLYTCDFPGCTRHAQILRSNLDAIGIDLDVRQFPLPEFFSRLHRPGEPWDLAWWNWFIDYPDPANFINDQFAVRNQPTSIEDPSADRRMAAAARLSGAARLRAYAQLDRYLAERVVPAAPFASGTITHFLSARMGCQVLHPVYGLDLAALCVRDDSSE
jgi:YVTN family beta-propeller protein